MYLYHKHFAMHIYPAKYWLNLVESLQLWIISLPLHHEIDNN